jgi:hypothetical protein
MSCDIPRTELLPPHLRPLLLPPMEPLAARNDPSVGVQCHSTTYCIAEILADRFTTFLSDGCGADGHCSFSSATVLQSMKTHCTLSTARSFRLYPHLSCPMTSPPENPLPQMPFISHTRSATLFKSTNPLQAG